VINALTIDVEAYFQVGAIAPFVAPTARDHWDSRVMVGLEKLLEMLAQAQVHATFFTLGWVARKHPELVRRIHAAGHEIASHGCDHIRTDELGPAGFFQDILRARHALEECVGVAVRGYRAPSFSISAHTPWAHELIAQAGYRYSSSIYPVNHDHYGMPEFPRRAQTTRAGVVEIPITTVSLFNRNWPAGGGGFFRLLPYALSRWMIRRCHRADQQPVVFYCHPWEFDPDQPRVAGLPFKNRFRHYLNLHRTEDRFRALLRDFRWGRMDQAFAGVLCG
jgi:polysaccharide deacetylase family protein (PEP-CTERM system associated)